MTPRGWVRRRRGLVVTCGRFVGRARDHRGHRGHGGFDRLEVVINVGGGWSLSQRRWGHDWNGGGGESGHVCGRRRRLLFVWAWRMGMRRRGRMGWALLMVTLFSGETDLWQ